MTVLDRLRRAIGFVPVPTFCAADEAERFIAQKQREADCCQRCGRPLTDYVVPLNIHLRPPNDDYGCMTKEGYNLWASRMPRRFCSCECARKVYAL